MCIYRVGWVRFRVSGYPAPACPHKHDRDVMGKQNSVAPVWDKRNLAGAGGVAFWRSAGLCRHHRRADYPAGGYAAWSYLRGVAFEFRFLKATESHRAFWDKSFYRRVNPRRPLPVGCGGRGGERFSGSVNLLAVRS